MNVQADTPLAMKARPCEDNPVVPVPPLSWRRALGLAVGAVAAFHLAYTSPPFGFLVGLYLYCLFQLTALPTPRKAFYLRFSWLNVGYAFADSPPIFSTTRLGLYGVALVLMALAASLSLLPKRRAGIWGSVGLVVLGCFGNLPANPNAATKSDALQVAGLQMEFPAPMEVPAALDKLLDRHREAELFVLSEYTFDGPIPERVKAWCGQHKKYLIAGGKDDIAGSEFFNTAFVIDPDGEIVFRQAKSVPIQFFKDGQPAR